VTYYPARQRRNPWFRRFLAGAIVLGALLAAWLLYDPPSGEAPQRLLGWQPRDSGPSTNQPATTDSTNAPQPAAERSPSLSEITNSSPATSAPPAQFKPNPSLIVPPAPSHAWPARPAETVLEAQIALARQGLSPGPIDSLNGPRTRRAVRAFQELEGLEPTGTLDLNTRSRLLLTEPPYVLYTVTTQDMARLMPVPPTWIEKSLAPRLDYESLVELIAEHSQSSPDLIRQLNQDRDWSRIGAGTSLTVPNVRLPTLRQSVATLRINLRDRELVAVGFDGSRIALFPCSIAREVQDRLVGRLHVASIVLNPDYTFDPARFRQTPEVRQIKERLRIPPGPNNPVGVAWIGLDRPGYGIHGTPTPERVGQAESLGCFRLTNWNIELLASLAWVGMPVDIAP